MAVGSPSSRARNIDNAPNRWYDWRSFPRRGGITTYLTYRPTCQYPECRNTFGLQRCQKLDNIVVCPDHSVVRDGEVLCLSCQERLDSLLAHQAEVDAAEQELLREFNRRMTRKFLIESLVGYVPAIVGLIIVFVLVERVWGDGYRQFYPFLGISVFAMFTAATLIRSSVTTARPADFGSNWRIHQTYER